MEDTNEFVEKIKQKQEKDLKNKKRQGNGHPEHKLPNKRH
ncbi:DUF4023 domain-containing protein [Oceanobacillus salinisoli]|nr:DUF4023 domain-containing protein [Oceanobacillus salinisoli]